MSGPTLTIDQGKLQGKTLKDLNGNQFYSFQGIPYAKPPIGKLRFKAPEPAEPWEGTLDATKEPVQCYSRHSFQFEKIFGTEDCLVLNIYTPKSESLKPVMVFIHGGGFQVGSSGTELYGPEYLTAHDIVLVTVNYRIGILGFFSLRDSSLGVTGNAGLKDIIESLRWIKRNIKHFGGDSDNVTIFGESAGAAAVHYLLLSPLSRGLFHKAIAQSGCALIPCARARYIALEIAEALHLSTRDETKILDRLQALSIETLHRLSEKVRPFTGYHDLVPYGPCIEPQVEGAFISQEPVDIIDSGNYMQVPVIFGYNSREGMLFEFAARAIHHPRDFEEMVPQELNFKRSSVQSKTTAQRIKDFYYKNGELSDDSFYLLHSDNCFIRGIIMSALKHAKTAQAAIYLYKFSLDTELNIFKKIAAIKNPGACHGDDLGYLFKTQFTPEVIANGSREDVGMRRMLRLWTNFAKFSDPNEGNNDELIGVKWEPINEFQLNYLEIGDDLSVGVNPEQDRMEFWRSIFKDSLKYRF